MEYEDEVYDGDDLVEDEKEDKRIEDAEEELHGIDINFEESLEDGFKHVYPSIGRGENEVSRMLTRRWKKF